MPDNDDDPLAREAEDIRLQIAHARAALYDRARLQREARRQYARDYYAKHREEQLEYQRGRRAAQREKDPDAYRKRSRERNQRWRDKHKDEVNARIREKYHADPEKLRQRRREQYAANPAEHRARRREYYAKNRDKQNAANHAWRDREKRRRAEGLPAYRIHRTPREERFTNAAAANEYFGRGWTEAELAEALKSIATPVAVWAAWKRDCLRARAVYHLAEQKEELARLEKERGRARPGPKPKPRPTVDEIEEARLEAIGRLVNDTLRLREQPRRAHHLDPAAPHPMLQPNQTMGMNR